ncbi:hypothetical protein [Vibrio sinaloensis]|uniref:hypothetical protein n=1 Tax=Photobacterium sp. (strain ATCC 43367) TaxID=379097 RepID=UPI002046D42D|nr:hypothetical protein [Vibrio sinaloensis]UPQ87072.1 hypothetical protein MTO69_08505 [Vibrio sinaloensis]
MMNIKSITVTLSMLAVLSGCAAKPEPVNPVPFSDKNSYALNVANQTVLTRNDSPLRDFTQQEKENITLAIGRARSGGDTSMLFGGLKLLTLDLTGVIDIAGGAAANLADRDHDSGRDQWIIEVDATKFTSELEAQRYILDTLDKATLETLKKYGDVSKRNIKDSGFVYVINDDKNEYNMGGYQLNSPKKGLLSLRTISIDQKVGEFYTYGIKNSDYLVENHLVKATSPLSLSVRTKKDIDLTEYYKDLTKNLPEGFYLYIAAMPQFRVNNTTYTDYSEVLPAIYTQGKKYEFIKPE